MVEQTIAAHPEWVATTMAAVQSGIVEAIDRQKERSYLLSRGLVEALKDRRSRKRNASSIVDAIQVSQFHPTPWSAKMIAKEERYGP